MVGYTKQIPLSSQMHAEIWVAVQNAVVADTDPK